MANEIPQENKKKPVKIYFHGLDECPTFHAAGGWGLYDQQKGLIIKFYFERNLAPKAFEYPLDSDGNVSTQANNIEGVNEKFYEVVREFQTGVALSLDAAVQVRNLLDLYINSQAVLTQQQ